jgi:hypothetical protein
MFGTRSGFHALPKGDRPVVDTNKQKPELRQQVVRELKEYWINFVYLALFFGIFTTYQRIILEEYRISYLHYGFSVVKALVLAKVIMIGDMMRLSRSVEDKPLIVPTILNAVVFTTWVMLFAVFEHMVEGLLHGRGLFGGIEEFLSKNIYELLARGMVVFSAFIPFFGFRELERVLGEGRVRILFIGRRGADAKDHENNK